MKVEVSNGELLDKLSILAIKLDKFQSKSRNEICDKKYTNVCNEFRILLDISKPLMDKGGKVSDLYVKLLKINNRLWNVEELLRKKEKKQLFDEGFISLARKVYELNDKRALIKKEINIITDSYLVEEKSYV